MSKRITVMIPDHLDKQVRKLQTDLIKKSNGTVAYSTALCIVLTRGFKN
jgi:hypothetical protein